MEEQNITTEMTVSQLFDMTQEDFEYFVTEGHMPVGEASNLSFFFKSQYSQIVLQKDKLLEQLNGNPPAPLLVTLEKCLKDTYILLLDIENKTIFIDKYIKDKM